MSTTNLRDAAVPVAAAGAPGAGPSDAYLRWRRARRLDRRLVRGSQLLILVLFLALWEVAARSHWVNPMLTSSPSGIWRAFVEMSAGAPGQQGSLWEHTWVTVVEIAISFVVSMALGLAVAVALWWSDFLYRVLDPYLVVANAMPKIALVPIFYIWLGDSLSIYGIAVAIAVFIAILMIYTGFRQTDPNKVRLLQSMGASRGQVLTKLVLPGSLPTLVAALKATIGLVLVGVIVGEFQSSRAGLGYLIIYGSQIFQMNLVMVAIAILAVLSTVMYAGVQWLERAVIARRRG